MAARAKLPEVGAALRGVYDASLRNAVYHSNYVLHGNTRRWLSALFSYKGGIASPEISFDVLANFTNGAFAFWPALLSLWERARRDCFRAFQGNFLPS